MLLASAASPCDEEPIFTGFAAFFIPPTLKEGKTKVCHASLITFTDRHLNHCFGNLLSYPTQCTTFAAKRT
jgi:hypothetical protein